jgi:Family of unknown function (DUF6159)
MSGRWARGWAMARSSLAVLRQHPQLAVFPIISGTILLLVCAVLAASLLPQLGFAHSLTHGIWKPFEGDSGPSVAYFVTIFAVYYVLAAVVVFCNVALIHCALRCHAGEAPSVAGGLAAATGRLPQILGWTLIVATVGAMLHALEHILDENVGLIGAVIGALIGGVWSIASYFVIPVLASEGLGPIAAMRRSGEIVRSKWGESFAGETRFGLLGLLFFVQAAALFFIGLAIVLSRGAGGLAGLGPLLMAVGVAYGLATIVVLQALGAIFQAGVYVYANTGAMPPALDPALVEGAFRNKSRLGSD